MYFKMVIKGFEMSQSELVITISVTIKEGQRESLFEALTNLFVKARKQEGCMQITVHTNNSKPEEMLIYEIWKSEALWKKYLMEPYITQFSESTSTLTHKWEVKKFTKYNI